VSGGAPLSECSPSQKRQYTRPVVKYPVPWPSYLLAQEVPPGHAASGPATVARIAATDPWAAFVTGGCSYSRPLPDMIVRTKA